MSTAVTIGPDTAHAATSRLLGVNVGCGVNAPDGWYNIDNSPTIWMSRVPILRKVFRIPAWPRNVRHYNVLKGMPFSDATVNCIYSSHTFEHFGFAESFALVKECLRILKPGGILRIVVPDLETMVRDYLADSSPMAPHRFVDRLLLHHTWRDLLHNGAHHRQMFDARSLVTMLREAGFASAQTSQFGESRIPDISSIELESRRQESLYVEAQKTEVGTKN